MEHTGNVSINYNVVNEETIRWDQCFCVSFSALFAFSALTLLVWHQEDRPACRKLSRPSRKSAQPVPKAVHRSGCRL